VFGRIEVWLHSFLTSALWRRVVSFTTRPLWPRFRAPDTHWIWGWVGLRAGLNISLCNLTELEHSFRIISVDGVKKHWVWIVISRLYLIDRSEQVTCAFSSGLTRWKFGRLVNVVTCMWRFAFRYGNRQVTPA